MSQEQSMQSRAPVGGRQIRVRLDQLKRSPGLNLLGAPELIGLAGAALLALMTVFAYFYFYLPAQSRLDSALRERDLLQTQLRASQAGLDQDIGARTTVDQINASLMDFESNWLAERSSGRMSLYTELNKLIRSNGLRNTSGPAYATLDPLGTRNEVQPSASASQSNAKWQTIYPGIAVTVTVEGPYHNVRHFVRDIETSREFLIVNAVEIEGVTQSGVSPDMATAPAPAVSTRTGRTTAPPPVTPLPGTRSTLVSLRLDLATYFRRPGIEQASSH